MIVIIIRKELMELLKLGQKCEENYPLTVIQIRYGGKHFTFQRELDER